MAGLHAVSAAALPPHSHFAKAAERDRLAREHERRLLEEQQSLAWQNVQKIVENQKALQERLKMQAGSSSSSSSSSAGAIPPVIVASVTGKATAEPEPTKPEPASKERGGSADAGEPEKADDEMTVAGSDENEGARKKIRSKRPSAEFPQYQKK